MDDRTIRLRSGGRCRWRVAMAVAGLLVCVAPAAALAQSAAALYERALAREQAARLAGTASLESIRAIARSYEAIVLKFPASAYCDNALWQASGLLKLAFSRSSDATDRQGAERLLAWLRREYPSSSFMASVGTRLAELGAAATVPDKPSAVSPPAAPTDPGGGAAAVVRNITQSVLPRGERVTIELSREVSFTGERVDKPDRVFVDFANATAASALVQRAAKISGTLIKELRVGRHTNGVTRVVLELAGSPRYSTFPLYSPFRLVIDLESEAQPESPPPAAAKPSGDTPSRPVEAAPRPPEANAPPAAPTAPMPVPPAITSRGDYSLARQLGLGISRIVIDPGHGGHDPGAKANAISEAELVLDVAQRLEKLLLHHAGVEVVLTRRTNEYIPLEERTAIANREGADLFLSIHANASHQTAARGIETYFLNFATNPDAERVAARENATSAQTMGTLPAILRAIALNNKLDESRELASILQTSLVRKLRAQNKSVKDLGVKQAPFVVLIGAQMPSVLAEISFVTNRGEASLLRQPAYRQQIAQGLCDAILKYQSSLKKVSTVTATGRER